MIQLTACPGCSGKRFREIYAHNDLADRPEASARAIGTSSFCACETCGLFFARRRQDVDSAAEFYADFAQFESRHYAVYPPPAEYVRGKEKRATQICALLDAQGLLRPDLDVLHLRCDGGTLLALLRERWGVSGLFGLDYFDSNIRYATEVLRLAHIARLDAGRCAMPFEQRFDLIVSNHMLTHALDPRAFLHTLQERLKPGGAVFFYNEVDHEALMGSEDGALAGGINAFHKQLLTPLTLADLLRRGGFSIETVRGTRPWLEVLARPAAPAPLAPADPAEVLRLRAMFSRWARQHERRRGARRMRRRLTAWVGPAAFQRGAAAYRRLRGLLAARTGSRPRTPAP